MEEDEEEGHIAFIGCWGVVFGCVLGVGFGGGIGFVGGGRGGGGSGGGGRRMRK